MRFIEIAAIAFALAASACSSDQPTEQAAPQPALSGRRPHAMRNCPSAVRNAVTSATPVADGVMLTVTSDDANAASEIIARARIQDTFDGPRTVIPPHSGLHSGKGNIGFCPIIHANTLVSSEPIAGGVRIHVKARSTADVRRLQAITAERMRVLQPSS